MATNNAYAELGLAPGASEAEIKTAWRRLVSKWHPDRNGSAAAVGRMQRINQAFESLRGGGLASLASSEPARGAEPAGPPRRTIVRKLRLTLEDAAAGCIKMLRGKLIDTCAACAGAGQRWPGGACTPCAGVGTVRERNWFGWFGPASTCEACGGDGVARAPCTACATKGTLPARPYRISVRIPPGVRGGDVLHVDAGRVRPGEAAVAIDLHIELLPHALFKLDADGTIRCELRVDGFTWMANRTVDVPTLAGPQKLRLNRTRMSHRLTGVGFPVERRGSRGNQVVTVIPVFPDVLSTDQDILIDRLVATNARLVSSIP